MHKRLFSGDFACFWIRVSGSETVGLGNMHAGSNETVGMGGAKGLREGVPCPSVSRVANPGNSKNTRMKNPTAKAIKMLVVLTSVSLGVSSASAQLAPGNPDYEPFADATGSGGSSYSSGANLDGQTSASYAAFSPTGQQWSQRTGPGSGGTQPTVASGSLSYPGLAPGAGGGSASFGPDGDSAMMNLSTGTGGIGNQAGKNENIIADTVFFSFVMQLTDLTGLSATGVGLTALTQLQGGGAVPGAQGAVVMVRSATGGFNLGIDVGGKAVPGNVQWDNTVYTTADSLFLVGTYDFNDAVAQNDADAQLWIDPDASTLGAASAPTSDLLSGTSSAADMTRVASFMLMQPTSGPAGQIDDVRVGLNWADVTPVPEPSSALALGLLALAGVGVQRFRRKSH
jgi:hypothetical protein